MDEQFMPYEIALKLKELGFDEECLKWSKGTKDVLAIEINYIKNSEDWICNNIGYCAIPLWQQAEQWFRDTHNYYATVYRLNNKWCGDVYDMLRQRYITYNALNNVLYDTYEEAREQAILKCIELLKNK